MGKVRIHKAEDVRWSRIRDDFPPELLQGLDDQVLDSEVGVHEDGDATQPHMSEAFYKPGAKIAVHSHSADEFIYVVSGSMSLGRRELGPGSSIFVEAKTMYGFSAGPEGVRMVVFRPFGDDHSVRKDQEAA
jgi:quercetin dioxygenase-like cupin family protein